MTDEKKTPGPKPELLKVPLAFKDAIEAALKTKPPSKTPPQKPKQ